MSHMLTVSGSPVKPQTVYLLWHDLGVTATPSKLVAANLKRLMDSGRGPVGQNAIFRACNGRVSQSTVGRMLSGETNTGVDTVQIVAELYGLEAWQLLLPNLNIDNPQAAPLTAAEELFYDKIRAAYEELPKAP